MSIKLYGSTTSPFVRRIRLILLQQQQAFEWVTVNVFDEQQGQDYLQLNPTLRVPCIELDGEVIWDSTLILQQLLSEPLNLLQLKQLALVNEANDAGVYLFQSIAFEVDAKHEKKPANQAKKRLAAILQHFETQTSLHWDIIGQCLYCMLDWSIFRGILSLDNYPQLNQFYNAQQQRQEVRQTDPRLT